jgi:uroporphyrinogen decarboxylase
MSVSFVPVRKIALANKYFSKNSKKTIVDKSDLAWKSGTEPGNLGNQLRGMTEMDQTLVDYLLQYMKKLRPNSAPVVLWSTGPFVGRFAGIKIGDYSKHPELKLKAQLGMQRAFPQTMMFPGLQADYGVADLTSAFGCKVEWPEDDTPHVSPTIENIGQIDKLKPINPEKDGLLPVCLDVYRYFWDHIDKAIIDNYGYLDGMIFTMGPTEVAAIIRGFTDFFLDILDHPKQTHTLLDVVTESCLKWLRAQEDVNGKAKRLFLLDHIPGQISPAHFEEFCLPYYKQIFSEYPDALKIYHNENNVAKVVNRIGEMGADIFQFGIDIKIARDALGGKMCLMGNLLPTGEILNGSPETVTRKANQCLEMMSGNRNYLLSTAGGMAPGTPKENIQAMIDAAANGIDETYQ